MKTYAKNTTMTISLHKESPHFLLLAQIISKRAR